MAKLSAAFARPFDIMITPWSFHSCGVDLAALASAAPGSATYPVANQAVYVPFYVPGPVSVVYMFHYNGTAVSGNVDIGIYNEYGTKLVSTGAVAQSGTSTLQAHDITDTVLPAGRYYMAISLSNTTGTFFRVATTTPLLRSMGVSTQTSAHALPATFTLAAAASAYLPYFGLALRTTV